METHDWVLFGTSFVVFGYFIIKEVVYFIKNRNKLNVKDN